MRYVKPSVRLDKLNQDLASDSVPVLVSGFAQAIRDHEHQIADLVLSICARALSNGEASLETAVASIADKAHGKAVHPHELLKSPYMRVEVIDSGIFADLMLTRAGAPRTSGLAEDTLEQYGWDEIASFSSLVLGASARTVRPTFFRSSLWAPTNSALHKLTGPVLYAELRRRINEQVESSRLLGLGHIYWHSVLTQAYLLDMRGEVFTIPGTRVATQRAPHPRLPDPLVTYTRRKKK